MSNWSLEFSKEAERDLANLDRAVRERVIDKLDWFTVNFSSLFPIPLTAEFREFCKLRIGDWRVYYSIRWSERVIRIEYIDHRSRAYKKKK